jgi:hypothetical protein
MMFFWVKFLRNEKQMVWARRKAPNRESGRMTMPGTIPTLHPKN